MKLFWTVSPDHQAIVFLLRPVKILGKCGNTLLGIFDNKQRIPKVNARHVQIVILANSKLYSRYLVKRESPLNSTRIGGNSI